jgi:hypothetical protein
VVVDVVKVEAVALVAVVELVEVVAIVDVVDVVAVTSGVLAATCVSSGPGAIDGDSSAAGAGAEATARGARCFGVGSEVMAERLGRARTAGGLGWTGTATGASCCSNRVNIGVGNGRNTEAGSSWRASHCSATMCSSSTSTSSAARRKPEPALRRARPATAEPVRRRAAPAAKW